MGEIDPVSADIKIHSGLPASDDQSIVLYQNRLLLSHKYFQNSSDKYWEGAFISEEFEEAFRLGYMMEVKFNPSNVSIRFKLSGTDDGVAKVLEY